LSSQAVLQLLNGNFHTTTVALAMRDSEFYDSLINDLPDSIIICNHEFKVLTTNKTTNLIYGRNDLIGTDIRDFFRNNLFDPQAIKITDNKESTEYTATNPLKVTYMNGNEVLHLNLSSSSIGTNYVYVTRNVTQLFNYNKLIQDERAKSDSLLSSILPASLVTRVQSGEKNISFAVQNASVIFMDIVSFTPWCASNTAANVMTTLSTIFRENDNILNKLPTMSKIKCIGDCYMAAGGIFDEVNNPSQHAKEVVEFGCEAIKKIREIDELLHENLQIRVGVNSGGPIVAGVLGTEKPTFEILGPPINIAQQMEHFGVPMQVHISRTVYELIYGNNFDIKERGNSTEKSKQKASNPVK